MSGSKRTRNRFKDTIYETSGGQFVITAQAKLRNKLHDIFGEEIEVPTFRWQDYISTSSPTSGVGSLTQESFERTYRRLMDSFESVSGTTNGE